MKLVRDKIPEIIKKQTGSCDYRKCKTEEEYLKLIYDKLFEEANEFLEKPSTEELIDIITVCIAILKKKGIFDDSYSLNDIFVCLENKYNSKVKERGEFKEGYILK